MNIGVLLSAGIGNRFRAKIPKQYIAINGKAVIEYSINELKKSKLLDDFFVVVGHEEVLSGNIKKQYNVQVIEGGKTRAESFNNALQFINNQYPNCKKVIFHEAARPLIKADVFDHYINLLDEYDYVESCKKITDSLGCYLDKIPDREQYYLIQAPEAYRFEMLYHYFDVSSEIYYAAHQLPKNAKGYRFFDIPANIKLTFPEDVKLIEFFMQDGVNNSNNYIK